MYTALISAKMSQNHKRIRKGEKSILARNRSTITVNYTGQLFVTSADLRQPFLLGVRKALRLTNEYTRGNSKTVICIHFACFKQYFFSFKILYEIFLSNFASYSFNNESCFKTCNSRRMKLCFIM